MLILLNPGTEHLGLKMLELYSNPLHIFLSLVLNALTLRPKSFKSTQLLGTQHKHPVFPSTNRGQHSFSFTVPQGFNFFLN